MEGFQSWTFHCRFGEYKWTERSREQSDPPIFMSACGLRLTHSGNDIRAVPALYMEMVLRKHPIILQPQCTITYCCSRNQIFNAGRRLTTLFISSLTETIQLKSEPVTLTFNHGCKKEPQAAIIHGLMTLRIEQVAAIKRSDEQHQELPKGPRDYNTYTHGSIGSHNIAIACLPLGHLGTTSASRVANLLPTSFVDIRLISFVGVSGGFLRHPPRLDASQDIHFGDVVVGVDQTPGVAGVVQYDSIGHQGEEGRELLGILDRPNTELLTALRNFLL